MGIIGYLSNAAGGDVAALKQQLNSVKEDLSDFKKYTDGYHGNDTAEYSI